MSQIQNYHICFMPFSKSRNLVIYICNFLPERYTNCSHISFKIYLSINSNPCVLYINQYLFRKPILNNQCYLNYFVVKTLLSFHEAFTIPKFVFISKCFRNNSAKTTKYSKISKMYCLQSSFYTSNYIEFLKNFLFTSLKLQFFCPTALYRGRKRSSHRNLKTDAFIHKIFANVLIIPTLCFCNFCHVEFEGSKSFQRAFSKNIMWGEKF